MSKRSCEAAESAEGTFLRMGAAERPGFAGGELNVPSLWMDALNVPLCRWTSLSTPTSGERSRI